MRNFRILVLILITVFLFQTTLRSQDTASKQIVSFEAFEKKLEQASPNPQILDARTLAEYELNHLSGAINVAVSNEADLETQLNKLDKSKPVFVYSINNGRSGSLAKKLGAQNFVEVYELPGGISKWIGAGNPVVSTTTNELTLDEYTNITQSNKWVLVDVHSKFCGSCKKLVPIVDAVARENSEIKILKLELFENKSLGKDLNIQSIPTLILYKDNKIVWQQSGFTSKATIDEILNSHL